MSTSRPEQAGAALRGVLAQKSALVVGAGGLGCPALLALVRAGVGRVAIADDDRVEETNLHRQILYTDADVGRDKLDAALGTLGAEAAPAQRLEAIRTRLLPENARRLVRDFDVVLEGADNFATKFLCADACRLEERPVVHGAAVRFRATVWSVAALGRPCYRCLFEDLPPADAGLTCAEAGVLGPVVGLAGALMADLALDVLAGSPRTGLLYAYDGLRDALREVSVTPRPDCALCGERPTISRLEELCYIAPDCAAGAPDPEGIHP
ncbi:MAG TPA: HesA/MoeB/ThiF family protein [Polyangiaceae bacterium]